MRLAERRTFSKPRVEKLKIWFEQQLTRVPLRGKLADAIRYALTRWHGLTRFLHDGRVELDTNPVERAIRPVSLGRKNHLFAGSDVGGERWATLCSIIETCKLHDVAPVCQRDVTLPMIDRRPVGRRDERLPRGWTTSDAVKCSGHVQTIHAYCRRPAAAISHRQMCEVMRCRAKCRHSDPGGDRGADRGTNSPSACV